MYFIDAKYNSEEYILTGDTFDENEYLYSAEEGDFFDFAFSSIPFTDYSRIDFNLIFDNGHLIKGDKKYKHEIDTVNKLRNVMKQLLRRSKIILSKVNCDYRLMCGFVGKKSYDFELDADEEQVLIEELIFGSLFDIFCLNSHRMTLYAYSDYAITNYDIAPDYNDEEKTRQKALRERIARGLKTDYKKKTTEEAKAQLEALGIDFEVYEKLIKPRRREASDSLKRNYEWDAYYYNFEIPLTAKQYRRKFNDDGKNYTYEDFLNDLQDYDKFIDKRMPDAEQSYDEYFERTMACYRLESYKQIDFMVKMIEFLPDDIVYNIDVNNPYVHYLTPACFRVFEDGRDIKFELHNKRYRNLLILRNAMLENESYKNVDFNEKMIKCELLYFKTMQLFNYHFRFIITDDNYEQIVEFINKIYDFKKIHESNSVWQMIKGKKWKELSKKEKDFIKDIRRKMFKINSILFH